MKGKANKETTPSSDKRDQTKLSTWFRSAAGVFFFLFFQPTEAFVTLFQLFVQYCSAICCLPSDHTVGRPRFEPGTGGLEAGTLTTRPPPYCSPQLLLPSPHSSERLTLTPLTITQFWIRNNKVEFLNCSSVLRIRIRPLLCLWLKKKDSFKLW